MRCGLEIGGTESRSVSTAYTDISDADIILKP